MTTNQTIDGVPRKSLEQALKLAAVFDDGGDGADAESARGVVWILRALLDAPIPFPGYPPVPDDRKLPAAQPQGETGGYVLAKQTAVEVPGQDRKELGYTLLDGIGIFQSADEVHAAIAELGLPLGWVSMTVDQLLPGYMMPTEAEPPAPVAVVLPEREYYTQYMLGVIPSNAVEVNARKDGWNACLDEVTRLNTK